MTIERIILIIIASGAALWLIAGLFFKTISKMVGDCSVVWVDEDFKVEEPRFINERQVVVEFSIPINSAGKQQCLIIDVFGRIHPEGDKYCKIDNNVYVYPGDNRRRDGYWEATLIKPGKTLLLKGEMTLTSDEKPISESLKDLRYLEVDLLYKYYCRNPLEYKRKVLRINLPGVSAEKDNSGGEFETVDGGGKTLPIRTPLLCPGDNIHDVFEKYAKKHAKEGDILAVCESALAIMEGRAYYVEDIKLGFLSRHINKLFKMDSSLSSPYSLEMGIREVGAAKIIFSIIAGAAGRLIGRAGDFYLFAGRAVATIDDCTGTLPPFDKYVVMGPKSPQKSAEEFKKKTGFDMAVVDVNDLGKVDVLGLSDPSQKDRVMEALKTNPQGNDNQQLPIALIR
jgi:hypothetical protein